MPNLLGSSTKTLFLKQENHKLTEEFEVKELVSTLSIDADLIASNSTIVTVNGIATSATGYASGHDATMTAIAAKVAAIAGVRSCVAAARVLTIEMDSQVAAPVLSAVTTGGSSAGTWTAASDVNTVYASQPVKLTTDGKIEPLSAGGNLLDCIGHALQGVTYGRELVTVQMRASSIIYAEATASSHTAAPVKVGTYNTQTSRCQFDDASVTHENCVGHSLDDASAAGDEIRVALL